jgi:mannose-6-phosphate isomerase
MFLPSGRVHAIGAGLVIFEIQQNSDTTYRVFDWNRLGLDGRPRELHVAQSLASINFNDFEPVLARGRFTGHEVKVRPLVNDPLFNVEAVEMKPGAVMNLKSRQLQIVAALNGRLEIQGGPVLVNLSAGQFCLIPASLERTKVSAKSDATWLRVETN